MKLVNTIEEQVISIRVDDGMELTGTGLEDALKDQTPGNVHSLEILGGTFRKAIGIICGIWYRSRHLL